MRGEIEKGRVKVDASKNPADMLTKAPPKEKFELCMNLVHLCRSLETT